MLSRRQRAGMIALGTSKAAQTVLGRLATPGDVARAVAFCAGDDSGFITGTTAPVNGGLAMDRPIPEGSP